MNELKISFTYTRTVGNHPYETNCFITPADNDAIIGEGCAFCHPNDPFNKSKGRKLALARAMKDANLNQAQRTELWAEYFKTHKK